MKVVVFTDARMEAHDPGPGHPERPERLVAARRGAVDAGVVELREPQPLDVEDALLVHTQAHVDRLESLRGRRAALDADTMASSETVALAYLSAGAVRDAVLHAIEAGPAIALSRPPGHHAEPDQAMGFCFLSNVAIAVKFVLARGLASRVLVVDWDVHAGNGTERAFFDDGRVLFFDTHQDALYPGTGAVDDVGRGPGRHRIVNVPLPAGADDADLAAVYARLLVRAASQFRPDLVVVSAGFDGHMNDPLASLALSTAGYAHLCQVVKDIADRHANGRIAIALEGGYDEEALASCVAACARVLQGEGAAVVTGAASAEVELVIARVIAAHPPLFAEGG